MFISVKCGMLIAVGSILNIYPSVCPAVPRNQSIDSVMIGKDWYKVGGDLTKAITSYESQQSKEEQRKAR